MRRAARHFHLGGRWAYYVHRPHEGSALSQRFFFLLQLRQTLEDFAAATTWAEGEGAAEDEAADIWGRIGRKDSTKTEMGG